MRRFIPVLMALAIVAVPASAQAATEAANVTITKAGFVPASVTINQGDAVTWTNTDTADHQLVSKKAGLNSPVLQTGQSYTFTFKSAGNFDVQDAHDKRLKGTVVVRAAGAQSVAISSSSVQVVYGTTTTISGSVSNQQSGERVTIFAQRYGESSPSQVATVTTGSGGAWSYQTKPTISTTYSARWKGANSAAVMIGVRPLVTFRILTGGRFSTRVVAARTFAGHFVQFQRRSSFGQWVTLKRIRLSASSGAIFRATLPRGTSSLRLAISVNQAGAGYLAGFSRTIVYHR
jgi:plastocyanin